ncbi:MAG TPA: CBS domain-containing protein [Nitrososphaera sp.]|jgi:CBS domain-containing protein
MVRTSTYFVSLDSVPVSSIMVRDVKTVGENDSLQQACNVMQINNIGSVVVVASNKESKVPVGIVTERDVVKHIAADPSRSHLSARELMSHPLITISPNTSLKDALLLIVSRGIRRLPVVDNGILVGMVTDKDIYMAIARSESLASAIISDELLVNRIKELEQPWVYKLDEILHRRLGSRGSSTG